AAHGGSAMLRGLAGVPLVTPVAAADSRLQVVSIDDVAATVALSLRPGAAAKVTWELAHPQVLTLGELVRTLRAWHGFPPQPQMSLPRAAAVVIAWLAGVAAWLGWPTPARGAAHRGAHGGSAALVAADRHQAENPRRHSCRTAGGRAGPLVRPALSAQAARHRQPGAVLDRDRLDRARSRPRGFARPTRHRRRARPCRRSDPRRPRPDRHRARLRAR